MYSSITTRAGYVGPVAQFAGAQAQDGEFNAVKALPVPVEQVVVEFVKLAGAGQHPAEHVVEEGPVRLVERPLPVYSAVSSLAVVRFICHW